MQLCICKLFWFMLFKKMFLNRNTTYLVFNFSSFLFSLKKCLNYFTQLPLNCLRSSSSSFTSSVLSLILAYVSSYPCTYLRYNRFYILNKTCTIFARYSPSLFLFIPQEVKITTPDGEDF